MQHLQIYLPPASPFPGGCGNVHVPVICCLQQLQLPKGLPLPCDALAAYRCPLLLRKGVQLAHSLASLATGFYVVHRKGRVQFNMQRGCLSVYQTLHPSPSCLCNIRTLLLLLLLAGAGGCSILCSLPLSLNASG